RRLMASKQQSATVTQQVFRSFTQVLDDLSGGLLPRHQPYRFACINMGEIVVLAGDGFDKLLTRFASLRECIDVGVPAISKTIAQSSTGILRRPGQSLRHVERAGENGICFLSLDDARSDLVRVL